MTLIEMLVVLAIIAAVASVSALSLGSTSGENGRAEATRLATRVQLAADQALIEGRPLALTFQKDGYAFLEWDAERARWNAATLPALEERYRLPGEMTLKGPQGDAVLPLGADSSGRAFSLELEEENRSWTVDFDGATARIAASPRDSASQGE